MDVISFFSGCGGLDLGFKKAGFNIKWHNEFDTKIIPTLKENFKNGNLDKRDIRKIKYEEIPNCIGIIGGPPCQSWSEIGNRKGIEDERGQLFYSYVEIIKNKQPLFFLAENVGGILYRNMKYSFNKILNSFKKNGYNVSYHLINSKDYGVPQDRKRVFIIGYKNNIDKIFNINKLNKSPIKTLKQSIFDLRKNFKKYPIVNHKIKNHEYYEGSFSSIYMSRNRKRNWNEPSFTIQASARHIPIHPDSSDMIRQNGTEKRVFKNSNYRRLSVRECARIQTFPDDFTFIYDNINNGYKMIGNAVPVLLAKKIAKIIREDV